MYIYEHIYIYIICVYIYTLKFVIEETEGNAVWACNRH